MQRLESSLTEKRFRHCIGVYETSFVLADAWKYRYDIDQTLLAWASLFHDCGKELRSKDIGKLVKQGLVPWGLELLTMAQLSHAPLGANVLKHWYDMNNEEVLKAVAFHPTGSPELTPIGWIVYISDYLEPNRVYLEKREVMLEEACRDPLAGLRLITDIRIETVRKKNLPVNTMAYKFQTYIDSLVEL